MRKLVIFCAAVVALAGPALGQQPAAQPTTTQKAMEAAGGIANKVLGSPPTAQAAPAKAPLVNINKASPAELDALPQIGDARTKAIIAGRPYKTTHDLVDRKILPAGVYDGIKDKIATK